MNSPAGQSDMGYCEFWFYRIGVCGVVVLWLNVLCTLREGREGALCSLYMLFRTEDSGNDVIRKRLLFLLLYHPSTIHGIQRLPNPPGTFFDELENVLEIPRLLPSYSN